MKPMPDIASVMTPFPHSIEHDRPLSEAKALMYAKEIRHLPVTSEQRLVGILTDRDLKLALAVIKTDEASNMKVSDVCNYDAYVVDANEKLDKVLTRMLEQKIGSAIVTNHHKLVGIFTMVDATKKLLEVLRRLYPDA